jgi:hypothetical protein
MNRQILMFAFLMLCSVVTFVGGYHLGKTRAENSTSVLLIGSGLLDKRTVLKMVEKPDSEGATKFLNSSIDADVLQLGAFLPKVSDSQLEKNTHGALRAIALDRRSRSASKDQSLPNVDSQVDSILEREIAAR